MANYFFSIEKETVIFYLDEISFNVIFKIFSLKSSVQPLFYVRFGRRRVINWLDAANGSPDKLIKELRTIKHISQLKSHTKKYGVPYEYTFQMGDVVYGSSFHDSIVLNVPLHKHAKIIRHVLKRLNRSTGVFKITTENQNCKVSINTKGKLLKVSSPFSNYRKFTDKEYCVKYPECCMEESSS